MGGMGAVRRDKPSHQADSWEHQTPVIRDGKMSGWADLGLSTEATS